jgi:hypothetical protein
MTPAIPTARAEHALHAPFLALLPRVEAHGRVYFRHVMCSHRKEEYLAEMRGLAWKWYVRLAARGKDVAPFVSALAAYAARAAYSGRRVAGQDRAKDVLSPRAQRRHAFAVGPLPDGGTRNGNPLDEALHDNTRTPVPEQVHFRLDFPAWRGTWPARDRRVLDDLMRGERTVAAARKHGRSPARISQLRRAFHDDWRAFCGEARA